MNVARMLGALLDGAATPPRRATARRGNGPFGMTAGETRQIGRLLGSLADMAIEAVQPPPPSPAQPGRAGPPPPPRPATRARIPDTGGSPWTPQPAPPAADAPRAEATEALLLTQAMVAAARADGVSDAAERAAIARQLDAAGLDEAEREHVLAGFDNPPTPEALAQQAGDPMLRAQLYAACVAAMGQINPAERLWLDRLGVALKLDGAARGVIEKRLA
ncbi:DUF533 domain-containing protein [Rhodovarius sp.]|uniref:DUF533 domain-containing protein n=1 Tax=Rhodovarius sp. TaxID=2972673 RepID=UPI0034A1E64F